MENEIVRVGYWASTTTIEFADGDRVEVAGTQYKNNQNATRTIESTVIKSRFIQTGTTTDKKTAEYNKRVEECRTANGEFTPPSEESNQTEK